MRSPSREIGEPSPWPLGPIGDARDGELRSHGPSTRGLLRATTGGIVTHADGTACRLLDLPRDDLVGQRLARVVTAGDGPLERAVEDWIVAAVTSPATVDGWRGSLSGGSVACIELAVLPGDDENGADLLASLDAADLAVAGGDVAMHEPDFIGATAHELNNLLTVLLGNTDFLLDQAETPEAVRLAGQMRAASMRGAELAAGLLATARGRNPAAIATGLDRMLDRVVHRVAASTDSFGLRIDRRGRAPFDVPGIDPAALEDALVAFCRAAAARVARGGVDDGSGHVRDPGRDHGGNPCGKVGLVLEAKGKTVEAAAPSRSGASTAVEVVVDIAIEAGSDPLGAADQQTFDRLRSRVGAWPETAALSRLAAAAGGRAVMARRPDALVSLEFELQPADKRAASSPVMSASIVPARLPAAEMGRGERILLVEDDALVRVHVATQLRALDYDVIGVEGGDEAVAALKSDMVINLLFTDVVMTGGMSGWDVATRAAELRPGLAVLFTSGYARPTLVGDVRLGHTVHFLGKPYCRTSLAAALRRVVAAGSTVRRDATRPPAPPPKNSEAPDAERPA